MPAEREAVQPKIPRDVRSAQRAQLSAGQMLFEEGAEPVGILVVGGRGYERFYLLELDIIRSTGCRICAGTQPALEDVPLNRVRKNAPDLRDRLSGTYGPSDVLAHLLLSVIADGLV